MLSLPPKESLTLQEAVTYLMGITSANEDDCKNSLIDAFRSGFIKVVGTYVPKSKLLHPECNLNGHEWTYIEVDWINNKLVHKDNRWEFEKMEYFDVAVRSSSIRSWLKLYDLDEKEPQAKRVRKSEYDWEAFYVEVAVRADLDNLPDTPTELVNDMLQWCEVTWGKQPASSTVHNKIKPIYHHHRKFQPN